MLVQLTAKSGDRSESENDPVALLLACHARIRQNLRLAQRLVDAVSPSVTEIVEAASSLIRYFGQALPLHILDEDVTLCAALQKQWLPESCVQALATMREEHLVIEPSIAAALAAWRQLTADPLLLHGLRESLQLQTLRLTALLEAHLEAEERLIFPVVSQVLSTEEQKAVAEEIRARRQAS